METVEQWIEEWLALWPKEIKSGGESIRTQPKYCVNKMQKFCEEHPLYTKDVIFAATKLYLIDRRANGWFGVRRAMYFIHKQNVGSALAEFCERAMAPPPAPTDLPDIEDINPMNDFIN